MSRSLTDSSRYCVRRRYRLFRLASFGFLVHGTTSHWFYGKLDAAIPGTGAKQVFSKVFIDQVRHPNLNRLASAISLRARPHPPQVLWNPIFGIMFFSYVACLEWKGIEYVIEKTKNELMTQASVSPGSWPRGVVGLGGWVRYAGRLRLVFVLGNRQ